MLKEFFYNKTDFSVRTDVIYPYEKIDNKVYKAIMFIFEFNELYKIMGVTFLYEKVNWIKLKDDKLIQKCKDNMHILSKHLLLGNEKLPIVDIINGGKNG